MGNKTIYVKDVDLPLWEKIQTREGRCISSLFSQFLSEHEGASVEAEKKWVWFSKGAYKTAVDPKEVSSVCDSSFGGCTIFLRGGNTSFRVDGNIKDVSSKLGIPDEGV
jgi:hypothetical protein